MLYCYSGSGRVRAVQAGAAPQATECRPFVSLSAALQDAPLPAVQRAKHPWSRGHRAPSQQPAHSLQQVPCEYITILTMFAYVVDGPW